MNLKKITYETVLWFPFFLIGFRTKLVNIIINLQEYYPIIEEVK